MKGGGGGKECVLSSSDETSRNRGGAQGTLWRSRTKVNYSRNNNPSESVMGQNCSAKLRIRAYNIGIFRNAGHSTLKPKSLHNFYFVNKGTGWAGEAFRSRGGKGTPTVKEKGGHLRKARVRTSSASNTIWRGGREGVRVDGSRE